MMLTLIITVTLLVNAALTYAWQRADLADERKMLLLLEALT
jgi:hypothetical protein